MTRAEVKLWLQDTLGAREDHVLNHIRWLHFGLGRWFFNTDDGTHGAELWTTDMSAAGTRLLRDIRPGREGSFPHHKCVFGGRLYFAANDGSRGSELWTSDGTSEGTRLLVDIYPGEPSSNAQGLLACGTSLFFAASDAVHGFEMWASDGTRKGTHMLKDLTPGFASSAISAPTCHEGQLYFTTHGRYRWASDGTARGTRMVTDGSGAHSSSLLKSELRRRRLAERQSDSLSSSALARSTAAPHEPPILPHVPPPMGAPAHGALKVLRACGEEDDDDLEAPRHNCTLRPPWAAAIRAAVPWRAHLS